MDQTAQWERKEAALEGQLAEVCKGMDWIGLDWIGLDWIGLDWIELSWIGLDWTGLDWIVLCSHLI